MTKTSKTALYTSWVPAFHFPAIGSVILSGIVFLPMTHPGDLAYDLLYDVLGSFCHQLSERSYHLEGYSFLVCWRCTGIYLGLPLGFLVPWPSVARPARWVMAAVGIVGLDWLLDLLVPKYGYPPYTSLTGAALAITIVLFYRENL